MIKFPVNFGRKEQLEIVQTFDAGHIDHWPGGETGHQPSKTREARRRGRNTYAAGLAAQTSS